MLWLAWDICLWALTIALVIITLGASLLVFMYCVKEISKILKKIVKEWID